MIACLGRLTRQSLDSWGNHAFCVVLLEGSSSHSAHCRFDRRGATTAAITGAPNHRRQAADASVGGAQNYEESSDEGLSPRTLSNLLWAAFGVNRPRDLKLGLGRTAPSAMNKQEVEIYVVLAKSFISMTPRPTSLSRMATYGQRWARGTRPTRRRPLCTLLPRAMILPRSM